MEKLTSLEELLFEQLSDLYDAERQITMALPKMAKAAASPDLRAAFEEHLRQTETHRQRLDQVLQQLGQKPSGKPCKAMQGIITEGDEMIKERGDPPVRDAGLIAAAQRVEHYEMAAYGCVRTWAQLLGMANIASVLQQTLDEEGQTDKKLTGLAERVINIQAARS